ncbi:MAG: prolipoprotein diacylglyceryl transferase [Clostridia bacterium]|nr:prolipoprotein diacylglyceryl transferase [Clostridia bacterium]
MDIYNVTIFGIKLTIKPIAFTIPFIDWPIYWYGIIIATGFLLAIIYGMKNAKRFDVNVDKMLDVVIVTAPVSVLSARAYYVLFDGEKLTSIGDFFGFGKSGISGIAIYGSVIGAVVCGALMCKLKKIKLLDMCDLAALGFLIGQGIGRWGNFMNQEAYGTFTGSSWWGMTSNRIAAEMGSGELVHPCFLYESIWCIAGFFLIHHLSKKRHFSGEIALFYCVWYGFERSIVENFRTDSLYLWGPIRVSVVVSVIICVGAAITLFVIYKKRRTAVKDLDYADMFNYELDDTSASEEVVLEEDINE